MILFFEMYLFQLSSVTEPRDGCCFYHGVGYPVGEVIDVTVNNCTQVKYFYYNFVFLLQYIRPLWFVRKWMEKWLPLGSPRSILAIKSYSRKSRKMERVFRRSSMYLVEVLPGVELPTHHHRMELIFSYVN